MREINVSEITKTVAKLCIDANLYLPEDLQCRIKDCKNQENSELGKRIFNTMEKNMEIASSKQIPICQDTGLALIFVELGQDVHVVGGDLVQAINDGVAKGYIEGYLRLSVLSDPLEGTNTNNNTPAIIYTDIVAGDKLSIMVAPKGGGSENMSSLRTFRPSSTPQDIMDYVVEACVSAGSNPCPPMVVGVGIGGTADKAMLLSKKAMLRDLDTSNKSELYASMERDILQRVNESGIGPQGLGGDITALSVAIEQHPSHIAGFPVGVSIGCHVTRHKYAIL
ncbi:MAG: fumarate hydratase [Clostridia bacterium]